MAQRLLVSAKNPVRVRAGQIGARVRWGEPRVVRLDDLTSEQRALVMALVNAARDQQSREAA